MVCGNFLNFIFVSWGLPASWGMPGAHVTWRNFRSNFRSWFAYRTVTFKDMTSCLTPNAWNQNILTLFTVYLSLLTRKLSQTHCWKPKEPHAVSFTAATGNRGIQGIAEQGSKRGWGCGRGRAFLFGNCFLRHRYFLKKNNVTLTSKPQIPVCITCMVVIPKSKLSLTLWY